MQNKRFMLSLIGIVLVLVTVGFVAAQNGEPSLEERFVGTVEAPPFPDGLDWINVENPLTVDGLRGKIVLLDFWTYGCINCIHMIPTLERLEEKYAEELVVIGVHSAKFENEGQTENLRQIVQRYGLHHPVINDNDFAVWRTYGSRAWPTFAVISPRGNLVALQSGEVPFEAFDQYFSAMLDYYDELGTDEINREPLELALEGAGDPGTPLLFPGKVLVDAEGGRLFITDSSHHRVVIADLKTYEVLDIIGSGQRGSRDGAFDAAQFSKPQGTALVKNTLYIADTENHVIRAADLETREVRTVAGTGEMGRTFIPFGMIVSDPTELSLRSPWALEWDEATNTLHIAMAGTHQLWALDLNTNELRVTVGNGREANLNEVTLANAELAQPSGLHFSDGLLYFADSESSTIRVADFNDDEVRVISGTTENNLFDFGDIDGELGTNRLQHALGVELVENTLYVADTYNSRIKAVDLDTLETRTLFGQGELGGFRDGDADTAEFDEPGGIDYYDGKLYVADTNNHAIRVIDLDTQTVSTVQFPNPEALKMERNDVTIVGGNAADGLVIELEPQTASAGAGEIVLKLSLPDGYKINDLIDSTAVVTASGEAVEVAQENATPVVDDVEVRVPATFREGDDLVSVFLTLYYCEAEEQSLCFIDEVTLDVPVSINGDGAGEILLERAVTPPDISN